MTAEERIFLKREKKAVIEFENKTSLEICDEITPIIKSYKKEFVAKEVGCSVGTLNQYACSSYVEKNNVKPSYALYVKLLNIPIGQHYNQKEKRKLSDPEKKAEKAEYQHDYYESVTKPKRELKRQKKYEREEREEKARKRKMKELEEEFED